MSKLFTFWLMSLLGPGSLAHADYSDFCSQLLHPKPAPASAPYIFPEGMQVINLRAETDRLPGLKSAGELQMAFERIREAHVVKIDSLRVARKFIWPKLVTAESGYVKIPWKFAEDHCYLRAEMAASVLVDAGFPLPVAISLVTDQHRLSRATDENEEPPESRLPLLRPQTVLSVSGDPKKNIFEFQQKWNWHVALGYTVRGELWILDPSISYDRALRLEDWYSRLAKDVDGVQVEVGWPFSLGNRRKSGQRLSLQKCFSGSVPEQIAAAAKGGRENKLAQVYRKFQAQNLLGYCKGTIDEPQMEKLNSLFWSVAGSLKKLPDLKFLTD